MRSARVAAVNGLLLSALLSWAPTPAAAAATLRQAVDAALARSPSLAQARARRDEAQAALGQARLASLPRLTARAAATRGDDPVYAFGSLLEQKRFGPRNFDIGALNDPGYLTNVKTGFELGVPLFTAFALRDGRELGRLQVQAASAGEEGAAQAASERTAESYLRTLLGAALVAEADQRIASASGELEEARRLRARGLVLGSDFYAAEAALGALEATRVEAAGELAAARAALAAQTGWPAATVASGSLEDVSYSTAAARADAGSPLAARPDLEAAAAAESSAAVLARRERSSALPTVSAFASVETNTSDFGSNPSNRMIGVRAELPLGDATYFERSKRAEAARRAAAAGREAAAESASIETGQALADYEAAQAAVPLLRDSAEKARRSLELFVPLYREGRQSILDVLRAEDALLRARAGYLRALFSAHLAFLRLRLAQGRLDAAAVDEVDRRLGGAR